MLASVSAAALALTATAPADGPAIAAEAALAAATAVEEQPGTIVVTGSRDRYGAERTSSATRTDTPLQDVPQSISVVTERQIDDQAMRSIGDVVRYLPGVTIGQGEGHRDQITLRGNNSTADFFIDGLRDDIQYYRPLYNVERVEVLRGPNAMIFGRGGGGGVVNRVTKVPTLDTRIGGSASVNTFGAWHVDADINIPLGTIAALRVNGVHEEFGNHRDFYEGRLSAINPVVRVVVGPDTSVNLAYEYVDDARVVDRGVPSLAGQPLEGFRETFFGARGVNELGFEAHILRGTVEHRFSDALSLTSRLQYSDYDKSYRNAFPATPVTGTGANRQVGIEAYFDGFQRENLFSQTDLVWKGQTGALAHTLLAGVEFGRQDTGNQRVNGFFDSGVPTSQGGRRVNVPLADPIAIPPITFRAGAGNRSSRSEAEIFALYLQDQVEIGPVELIAGLRYDRFKLDAVNVATGQTFRRTDDLWSPRLGIVLHPIEPVSIYASYSRSFLPQSGDQFASLDLSLAALEPERFDNYEVGVKWEARPGLLLSAALYQLDRTNTRAPGPNPGEVVLTGAQRSRGLELEAVGEIMPNWELSLAYALQEAEITTTTAAAPAGRVVPQVPRHQFAAWTRYDLTDRLGVGLGVTHQSESFASISNAVELPAFTRVDLGVFVKLTERIEAQVNVENLLDEDYFPTAHNDNNISPGAPLNARFTVRVGF
ncbi:MAG TPA: TonB-dependent siderophore receptor [Allosphingosinicella sp.]|nr:TonB-dependent siderophore receptor [Allosphingosinicella sp.]